MKCVTAFVDGTNIYYFGIGATDNKLYRSNAIVSTDANVSYTLVSGLAALPITAKKVHSLKNGINVVSIEVLMAIGSLYLTSAPTLT